MKRTAVLLLTVAFAAASYAVEKPNFIVIFTDDQGYNDLSSYGSQQIKTPHIDSLAANGRKFTSFYVASPVCTPSRAALLTGCYPKRIGMENHVIFPQHDWGMHKDEVTIADALKSAGYSTACIGKWHLGHRKPFLPTSQGFDTYYGIPYSNDMNHPDNKDKPDYWGPKASDVLWLDQKSAMSWKTPLMQDEEIIELPVDQQTITRRYTDKTIAFIEANKDNPFFVYLPHSMPHVPLYVPDDVLDKDPKNAYKNTIEHIDAEVGRVLKRLRDLKLDKKTYVFFTSDNGPWLIFKHHGGSALPLRNGKGTTWEGGQRVPCLVQGPGIQPGTVSDDIFSSIDLLPTICALAGVELKTRGAIDGLDASGLLRGEKPSPRNEFLYYSSRGHLNGIRQGEFKLRRVKHRRGNETIGLYNLKTDIGEKNNLTKQMPNKVEELSQRMIELDAEIDQNKRPKGEI